MRTAELELDLTDAWAIQNMVRDDAVALNQDAGWTLRGKINGVLLRFAYEEKPPKRIAIPITLAECWMIDHCVSQHLYDGARDLLLRVFAAMRELEFGVPPLRRSEEITREQAEVTTEGGEPSPTAV